MLYYVSYLLGSNNSDRSPVCMVCQQYVSWPEGIDTCCGNNDNLIIQTWKSLVLFKCMNIILSQYLILPRKDKQQRWSKDKLQKLTAVTVCLCTPIIGITRISQHFWLKIEAADFGIAAFHKNRHRRRWTLAPNLVSILFISLLKCFK